jgi:hypothetical protein
MRADRGRPGEPARPPDPDRSPRRRHPPAARDRRHHAAGHSPHCAARRPAAGRSPAAPDEHALVSRLAEHAIAVRPGTALGIPGTVRVSVPSQRGLRLLHSALRPTPAGRRPGHADARGPDHHDPAHGAARRGRVRRPSARRWLPAAPGAGEGKPTLANRKSRIMHRRSATHNVRADAPVTRFRVLADSEPNPSRDPAKSFMWSEIA